MDLINATRAKFNFAIKRCWRCGSGKRKKCEKGREGMISVAGVTGLGRDIAPPLQLATGDRRNEFRRTILDIGSIILILDMRM